MVALQKFRILVFLVLYLLLKKIVLPLKWQQLVLAVLKPIGNLVVGLRDTVAQGTCICSFFGQQDERGINHAE